MKDYPATAKESRHSTFSRCLTLLVLAIVAFGCGGVVATAEQTSAPLRVCADPNNLPFSNREGGGFENRLAELIAHDLGANVEYTWWAQRRGFVRNTVRAGLCDVVMGVPVDYELLAVTSPYYRSTYVFLSREDRDVAITSLEDPALRSLRIGLHVLGDDYATPPPAHALARRQVITNVVGYSIFGDYREPHPPARLVTAVASGEIDIAIAWGPLAGYFARQQSVPMRIRPIPNDPMMPGIPFAFDIAVGISRDHPQLRRRIDAVLERRAGDIRRVLTDFGIPHSPPGSRAPATRH